MIHKRWMAWTFGIHSEGAKCFALIFCMLVYRHSVVFGRVKIWDSGTRKKLGLSLHVDVCMTATSTLVLGRTLPTQQAFGARRPSCSLSDMARVPFVFRP